MGRSKTRLFQDIYEGTIAVWRGEYGFIHIGAGEPQVFFHASEIAKSYKPHIGDRLQFRIVADRGRLRATRIIRL